MQKKEESKTPQYDVGIIKMLRNNNLATGRDVISGYSTYFMLDYFDLLLYQKLSGKDKIYTKYWNIEDNCKTTQVYKAAYKTLSLFTEYKNESDIIQLKDQLNELSLKPFLGIIQISYIHYIYKDKFDAKNILVFCKQKLDESIKENINDKETLDYKIYYSSTSSDFCLVVKSATIREIYKISTLINNIIVIYKNEKFKFSTYTNVGIECIYNEMGDFITFQEDTIIRNDECQFALRFTADYEFGKKLYKKIREIESNIKCEPIRGLFGRYDFLLYITMREFSQLYSSLCKSKIVKCNITIFNNKNAEENYSNTQKSLIELLIEGIRKNNVKIINERVLIPIEKLSFEFNLITDTSICSLEEKKEIEIKNLVKKVNAMFSKKTNDLLELRNEFIEEWRAFKDITRELDEVINTYVPQGFENDSHVNWQILISDLNVTFSYISEWEKNYKILKNNKERKDSRIMFLKSLRIITDAINQHYKLLQNVNSQTWQSPLYEIQTQIDAEKMMIAYREFLFEYFYNYQQKYKNTNDKRPMHYPLVYPDLLTDKVFVEVPFPNEKEVECKLLLCKIPSFEYYGRMFNMIPWMLHEASHSIRTLERKERNEYLIKTIFYEIISQAIFVLLNRYSNDYGYILLGELEKSIIEILEKNMFAFFINDNICYNIDIMNINELQKSVGDFLKHFFKKENFFGEYKDKESKDKKIQLALLRHLGRLNLLDIIMMDSNNNENKSVIEIVEQYFNNTDDIWKLFELIFNNYYIQLTGTKPDEKEWILILENNDIFEKILEEKIIKMKEQNIPNEYLQDYCFNIRELKRLYNAKFVDYNKDEEWEANTFWKESIQEIVKELNNGFKQNKGFTELYRILNMIFYYESPNDFEIKAVEKDFDVLSHENTLDIIEREIRLYRESCADVYMTATLKLDAFGYCRQMFQTVSDASTEFITKWTDSVNIHRFRIVVAVLLSYENVNREEINSSICVSADSLLKRGEEYCIFSIRCIKKGLLESCEAIDLIEIFCDMLESNIKEIFMHFNPIDFIEDVLKCSILSLYLERDNELVDEDIKKKWKEFQEKFITIEKDLTNYHHVFHRIISFIRNLDLIINGDKEIIVKKREYQHFSKLYRTHAENYTDTTMNHFCEVVSKYYNTPKSALDKGNDEMLEDTIEFIHTYYYRNRFNIMSSEEVKEILEEDK